MERKEAQGYIIFLALCLTVSLIGGFNYQHISETISQFSYMDDIQFLPGEKQGASTQMI